MLVGYTVKLLAVLVLYAHMYRANQQRDREVAVTLADGQGLSTEALEDAKGLEATAVEAGMRDQTELDNKGFRYIL